MDLLGKEAAGAVARVDPGVLAGLVEAYMELQHLVGAGLCACG